MALEEQTLTAGRLATGPSGMSARDWKDILWRVYAEFLEDRITLIAAGASFYLLLALFPALAAFVSIYGFVADPQTIAEHIAFLGGVLPTGGIDLIRTQLQSLAAANESTLSLAFVVGLAVALWSANSGIKTLFEALNIAYEEREKRSFLRLNVTAFVFTLGAILIGVLFIVSVGIVPVVLEFVGLSGAEEMLVSVLRWPILFVASAAAISILYRYGPSREHARWQWVTWGSALASFLWLLASVLFSWYLANFADYNATYGSLGAVIGFMLWTWISVVILLLGAELNAEVEHQTSRDSTTGAPQPMGIRGATMADTLGPSYEDAEYPTNPNSAKTLPFGEDAPAPRLVKANNWIARPTAIAAPVAGFGIGIALGVLDRRRVTRKPATQAPDAAPAVPPLSPLRELLGRPETKEQIGNAARSALALAQSILLSRLAAVQKRRR
jgi:membrane protein